MIINDRATKHCIRSNMPGQAHELTFSCYRNQPFLSSHRVCNWLVESIRQARETHQFNLWAYVFMPDHVHLLICPRESTYDISSILKAIKTPVGKQVLGYLRNNNPEGMTRLATGQEYRKYRFWQKGGGYDRNINKVDTLLHLIRYIHNNPVRKKLVKTPQEWYYSSVSEWDSTGTGPIGIDKDSWPVR